MEPKLTLQVALIYTTMALYGIAMAAALIRRVRTARLVYVVGFLVALASYLYRWQHTGHVPMQNLFEVFLALGVLILPITLLCRRLWGIESLAADLFLGLVVLFPAGFIFSAEPQRLPPALQCWLFVPHVAVYMLAYLFMAKAAFQAAGQLWTFGLSDTHLRYEQNTYRLIRLAFVPLTLGLILGSWWGKLAWGDWWGWDPKELWSLASWLVYVFYLHWRYLYGRRFPRWNSLIAIFGLVVILVTLLWANLSNLFSGLHSYAT
jgi:ABC-type transport system involved in cytochrome c biogenesis permease subunit